MTISFSVWSMIGWTFEAILLVFFLFLFAAWRRLGRAMKTMVDEQQTAARFAREKFTAGARDARKE